MVMSGGYLLKIESQSVGFRSPTGRQNIASHKLGPSGRPIIPLLSINILRYCGSLPSGRTTSSKFPCSSQYATRYANCSLGSVGIMFCEGKVSMCL